MSCVAARAALQCLRPQEALRHGDVPQQIAQREFPRGVSPLQFVRWNTACHAHGPLAHIPEILQKRLNRANFHTGLALKSAPSPKPIARAGVRGWRRPWLRYK